MMPATDILPPGPDDEDEDDFDPSRLPRHEGGEVRLRLTDEAGNVLKGVLRALTRTGGKRVLVVELE